MNIHTGLIAAVLAHAGLPGLAAAGEEMHGRRVKMMLGASATHLTAVFPGFQSLAPAFAAGVRVRWATGMTSTAAVEWTPSTVFREGTEGGYRFRTTASFLSLLGGLRFAGPEARLAPTFLAGATRQVSLDTSDRRPGQGFRDPTWSITLGADLDIRLGGPFSVVPQVRWDTDGGRLTSGMQLRAGIGLRGSF